MVWEGCFEGVFIKMGIAVRKPDREGGSDWFAPVFRAEGIHQGVNTTQHLKHSAGTDTAHGG